MANVLGTIDHLLNSFDSFIEQAKNDPIMDDHYCGDVDMMKVDYIKAIAAHSGVEMVIMTKEDFNDKLMSYHDSMEGM